MFGWKETYCTNKIVQLSTLKWYWQWKPKISIAPLFLTTPWHVLLMFDAFLGLIGWHTNMAELSYQTLTLTISAYHDCPTPTNTHIPSPCDQGDGLRWDEIYCPKKSKQVPHLGIYGDRQMACRRRKHNQAGRYLFETKPDFRLVSNRYLPVSLPVAADHVGWLPVVHFCFSNTHIIFWITVISNLKWARTGRRVRFHNCSVKLQRVFRFLGLML